jgi:hypothetical protein
MKSHPSSRQAINIILLSGLLLAGVMLVGSTNPATAEEGEYPHRTTTIVVSYTEYEWWVRSWESNKHLCQVFTDYEGPPKANEIYIYCGEEIYETWANTETCPEALKGNPDACTGVYLHLVSKTPKEKEVIIELPTPEASVSLVDCYPTETQHLCSELPSLQITAQEPLPNEHITHIQGRLNDIPFMCEGQVCEVPLRVTPSKGVTLEFWADSSYGDSSKQYRGRVRVLESGVSDPPETSGWYVNLISEGWAGKQAGACEQAWEAFPPIGTPPDWLANPIRPELLASDIPLAYLAGRLIQNDAIDASMCVNNGLLMNGYASQCGLSKAREEVTRWQNLFDKRIIETAQQVGIPSQTLKRVFIQESQFWPTLNQYTYDEYGLGQLTELGADTVLLWNPDFFNQFCPLMLSDEVCENGYAQMEEEHQILLRGALLANINAACPECTLGIDLDNVFESISVFGETMVGNCRQTGQIITSATGSVPGEVSTYEDLWLFTLINYHAGAGCLAEAVDQVVSSGRPITWENVAFELEVNCPHAVDYAREITK